MSGFQDIFAAAQRSVAVESRRRRKTMVEAAKTYAPEEAAAMVRKAVEDLNIILGIAFKADVEVDLSIRGDEACEPLKVTARMQLVKDL